MGTANAHPSGRESHFFRPSPDKSSQQIYGNGHFIKTTEFETEGVKVREKRVMSDASDDRGEVAEDQVRFSLSNDDNLHSRERLRLYFIAMQQVGQPLRSPGSDAQTVSSDDDDVVNIERLLCAWRVGARG